MTIEAMKLALEALKKALDAIESWGSYASEYFQVKHDLEGDIENTKASITALRQAIEQAQKQQALDKKAENAIELGLDYEPIEEYDFRRIAFEYRNASTKDADQWFKRLEQAQQSKPVAYSYTSKITGAQGFSHHPLPRFTDVEHWDIVPLYTTQPVATNDTSQERVDKTSESVHEPVAWLRTNGTGSPVVTEDFLIAKPEYRCEFGTPVYTTPPQRTWVGLTDWEINFVANNNHPLDGIRTFARAIETKLKEKNT